MARKLSAKQKAALAKGRAVLAARRARDNITDTALARRRAPKKGESPSAWLPGDTLAEKSRAAKFIKRILKEEKASHPVSERSKAAMRKWGISEEKIPTVRYTSMGKWTGADPRGPYALVPRTRYRIERVVPAATAAQKAKAKAKSDARLTAEQLAKREARRAVRAELAAMTPEQRQARKKTRYVPSAVWAERSAAIEAQVPALMGLGYTEAIARKTAAKGWSLQHPKTSKAKKTTGAEGVGAAAAARANREHRDNVTASDIGFGLLAGLGGFAGGLVANGLIGKVMPAAQKFVGIGLTGLAAFAAWKGMFGMGSLSPAVRWGIVAGLGLSAFLKDTILGWLSKLPVVGDLFGKLANVGGNGAALPPPGATPPAMAGMGNVYDLAFEDMDGLGRYVATDGLGTDVEEAAAGVGAYVQEGTAGLGRYVATEGLGVDVRAATAGVGRYVATDGMGAIGFSEGDYGEAEADDLDDDDDDNPMAQAAQAPEMDENELAIEGLGALPIRQIKPVRVSAPALQNLQQVTQLQFIRESARMPGTWVVGLDRRKLSKKSKPGEIQQKATSSRIPAYGGVVPRGIFGESVFGNLNAVVAPLA